MTGPAVRRSRRAVARLSAASVTAGLLVTTALAATASAHVRVSSPDAAGGGYGKLVFRVPTESATASTVGLTVHLPTDHPFASVSARPKPGWMVRTTTTKLAHPVHQGGLNLTKAVTEVASTAKPGGAIGPGEFDEFELSVGPFPDAGGTFVLPAEQRYSDGNVVRWDETVTDGAEPEHPAPTLDVAAAGDAPYEASSAGAVSGADRGAPGSGDLVARVLAGVAVALGLGALALALTRARGDRKAA